MWPAKSRNKVCSLCLPSCSCSCLHRPVKLVSEENESSPEVYCELQLSCLDCMTSNSDCNRPISSHYFVVKLVLSNFVVFAVLMAGTPVGFPFPQMEEGLNDQEALEFLF